MCESCWIDVYGMPVIFNEQIAEVADMIKRLLDVDDTGGPLHPYVDDLNLSDMIIPFFGDSDVVAYLPEVRELCSEIARRLTDMPEGWRASCVAHAHGWAIRGHPLKDQTDTLQDL